MKEMLTENRKLDSEELFWHEVSRNKTAVGQPEDLPLKSTYLKDISDHSFWTDTGVLEKWDLGDERDRITKDFQTTGDGIQWERDIWPKSVQHDLNTLLFGRYCSQGKEHRASLFSLLPLKMALPPSWSGVDRDQRYWCSGLFDGLETAFSYISFPGNFFHMHVEQCFFPFYNYCYQGCKIWYWIQADDTPRLMDWLWTKLARQYDVTIEREDFVLVQALAYAKETLMLNPDELREDGFQVNRLEQRAGDVVFGLGNVFHWGETLEHVAVNEAINYTPIWWLEHGLPELIEWFETFFIPFIEQLEVTSLTSWVTGDSSIITDRIKYQCAHMCPREWMLMFVRCVERDVKQWKSDRRARINYIELNDVDRVLANLGKLQTLLLKPLVREFCNRWDGEDV
jgi:hypothetical protein